MKAAGAGDDDGEDFRRAVDAQPGGNLDAQPLLREQPNHGAHLDAGIDQQGERRQAENGAEGKGRDGDLGIVRHQHDGEWRQGTPFRVAPQGFAQVLGRRRQVAALCLVGRHKDVVPARIVGAQKPANQDTDGDDHDSQAEFRHQLAHAARPGLDEEVVEHVLEARMRAVDVDIGARTQSLEVGDHVAVERDRLRHAERRHG